MLEEELARDVGAGEAVPFPSVLLVFDEAPKEKVFGSCGEKDGWYRLVPYLVSMPTGAASFTVECTELTNHLAVDTELTAYEPNEIL